MSFNKTLAVLLLVLTSLNSNAQLHVLGKVTPEELSEKAHPKDTSAVAAILFKKGKVTFEYSEQNGFSMNTEVQTRIKIYKKGGYGWANQAIKYYSENSDEKVYVSDAVTYNLVEGKIEKTKLKGEGEFVEKINKFWSQKKITMPNVKEGSVIEFQYIIKSPILGVIKDWDFQSDIPVNYSEFKTVIPEYFVYKANQKGYIFPKMNVEKGTKSIVFINKEREGTGMYNTPSTSFSRETVDYQVITTIYILENVPAMKDESFVNNIDNYRSSISHERSMTKYPNTPTKFYSTDWESMVKTIYESENFGAELNKTGYFEEDVNTIISGLTSRDEKIAAIFNFVKAKVKWNEYNDYYCHDGVKKAYKDKVGNVAEINLMLTAMLRYAGIGANPVLVSTRSNGVSIFPNRSAYNYVISAVEIENDLILLDATEKFSSPNILPVRDLNWQGRLIRKEGTSAEVDLMPKTFSKENVSMTLSLDTSGIINGKIRKQISNHLALGFRQNNVGVSNESYLEKLEDKNNSIEIDGYVRENESDLSKPIVEMYSFKDSKSLEIIEDKIYISPLLFLALSENPFKQEKREYPVDFGYPTQDKYNIIIEIPTGYVVESLPTAMNLITGDDLGTFKYIIANSGNKIQIAITTDINTAIVPSDYYEVLKDFFQKMVDKQNEKIVLKKA